jgi:hypothetical protein
VQVFEPLLWFHPATHNPPHQMDGGTTHILVTRELADMSPTTTRCLGPVGFLQMTQDTQ